ncbi:transmembrane protein 171 [Gastrophryne carolinensis]
MHPTFSFSFGPSSPGWASRLIFFMFVSGVMLFCAGFLLSIFGFQTCQSENLGNCSVTFKVLGPALAVIGLGSVVMARSKARLEARRRQAAGEQSDPDSTFLCGESRQFVQFLIFGFLFVVCGILISILGVWIPGCGSLPPSQNVTGTESSYRNCGFLSLQIMGPLIVLIGLCFFVVAHLKKRHNLPDLNESVIDEEPQPATDEPFQITVGDSVIIFPPPPPPYFADPLEPGAAQGTVPLPRSDNPPSYNSIFNIRSRNTGQGSVRDQGNIYTIRLPSDPPEAYTNPYLSSDPPPKYEEKDPAEPVPSPSRSGDLHDCNESSHRPVPPEA